MRDRTCHGFTLIGAIITFGSGGASYGGGAGYYSPQCVQGKGGDGFSGAVIITY
ncbi:MAG: hypothetical protein AABZ06_10460 [Bdellovibrionota bacterium]